MGSDAVAPTDGTTDGTVWGFHACGLDAVPADDRWLSPWEQRRVDALRFPKRRSETRLGRWTAKQTIGRVLGLAVDDWAANDPARLATISVENLPSGAPVAYVDGRPAGIAISMTDRADWAVCMASDPPGAAQGTPTRIGCDLELVEPRSDRFVADWFTADERRMVQASADAALVANLVWSAKESALKVLQTGLRRDTRTVEVVLDGIDTPATDRRWRPWWAIDRAQHGVRFDGWWRRFGEFVLTCAADAPMACPRAITVPSPLDAAVPTHAWLDAPSPRI